MFESKRTTTIYCGKEDIENLNSIYSKIACVVGSPYPMIAGSCGRCGDLPPLESKLRHAEKISRLYMAIKKGSARFAAFARVVGSPYPMIAGSCGRCGDLPPLESKLRHAEKFIVETCYSKSLPGYWMSAVRSCPIGGNIWGSQR